MLLRGFSCFWILGGEDGAKIVLKTEENLLPLLELQTSIQSALYYPRTSPVNSPSHSVATSLNSTPILSYPKTASRPFPLLRLTSTQQEQLTTFSYRTTKKATSTPIQALVFPSAPESIFGTICSRSRVQSHARAERAQAENAASLGREPATTSRILC